MYSFMQMLHDLADDIEIDRVMNRRKRTCINYLRPLFVPQLACLLFYRIAHFLLTHRVMILPKIFRVLNTILFGADILPEATIKGGCFIGHTVGIIIGANVIIEKGCFLFGGVTVSAGRHPGIDTADMGTLLVGENTRIYTGAKVIGSLNIGSNVTIGANAVVLKSIADGLTVVGVPARPVRERQR